jgi:hypothetical protein
MDGAGPCPAFSLERDVDADFAQEGRGASQPAQEAPAVTFQLRRGFLFAPTKAATDLHQSPVTRCALLV